MKNCTPYLCFALVFTAGVLNVSSAQTRVESDLSLTDNPTSTDTNTEDTNNALDSSDSAGLQLAPIMVYGESYRTTGTKSELLPEKAPISYEIYDSDLLQQRQVDSINEAMRYVPGITPESRGTVSLFDEYVIRGFQSLYNYYDGLVLHYNGIWNLVPQIDAFATSRVEVLKGPTSVLYGSAPPGGMINQVAKLPLDFDQTQLRFRTGSLKLFEAAIDHNGIVHNDLKYRMLVLGRTQDGQMETTEESRLLLAPSLTWQALDNTSINVNAFYQKDPNALPSTPLPKIGTLISSEFPALSAETYLGDKNWNGYERDTFMLGYKLNHKLAPSITFLQNARYTQADALQKNTYHTGWLSETELIRTAYQTDESLMGMALDNQLSFDMEFNTFDSKLLLGLDFQRLLSDAVYQDTFGSNTPTMDMNNINHNQFDVATIKESFSYKQIDDIEQHQIGLYAQNEFNIYRFTLLTNARYDWYRSEQRSSIAGNISTVKANQNDLTGRVAVSYQSPLGFMPYVSIAESFEPTTGKDYRTGKNFEPTTARQWEGGLKYTSSNEKIKLSTALFDITQENVIINRYEDGLFKQVQQGEVTSTGFEINLQTRLFDQLDLQATYSQQEAKTSKDSLNPEFVGKKRRGASDRQASLWATYYMTDNFDISTGSRYIGSSPIDQINSDYVPAYIVYDMAMNYSINDMIRIGLSGSNITNEEYVSSCYDSYCWMGPNRRIELSLDMYL